MTTIVPCSLSTCTTSIVSGLALQRTNLWDSLPIKGETRSNSRLEQPKKEAPARASEKILVVAIQQSFRPNRMTQKEVYLARGSRCSEQFVGYSHARKPITDQPSIQPTMPAIDSCHLSDRYPPSSSSSLHMIKSSVKVLEFPAVDEGKWLYSAESSLRRRGREGTPGVGPSASIRFGL